MKKLVFLLAGLAVLVPCARAQQDLDREKLAQTGMKFLSVTTDPRAAALGGAVTALDAGSVALFHNPAGMAHQEAFLNLSLAQVQWLADIQYSRASASLRPFNGRFGIVGFSLMAVDYGSLKGTIRSNSEQGFTDLGTFSPTALTAGIGYARALTDRFSVGGHIKYALQDLGESVMAGTEAGLASPSANRVGTVAYDFGVLYRTGFRSLNFAVSARNFAREIVYEEESFQLPLSLQIGLSMDLVDLTSLPRNLHSFLLSVDAETPRDFAEQIKVGGEYTFMNILSLRAGYVFPSDEIGVNLGAGLRQRLAGIELGADYAYTDAGIFNQFSPVHRVSLQLSF